MRSAMLVLCTAGLLAASAAVAAPDKKPPPAGPGCKPNVSVILRGTLTNDPAAGATSFTMNVTGANAHGKSLKGLAVTIMVDANTKIRRQGAKVVEALALNDRAKVQLKRCKADLPLTAATVDDVAAARVTAQAAKP
jgi:hypothetical protein